MSIGKRIKFLAKAYLNDLFEGDVAENLGNSVKGMFEGAREDDGYEDIDLDELERRYNEEFADLHRATAGASGGKRRPARRPTDTLAKHYKTMDLKPDSDFQVVRAQFRKLMRKFHPDRYSGDKKKQAWATSKSQAISEAFAAIEKAKGKK